MKKPTAFDDYIALMKPRITALVLVTATIGYYLGGRGIDSYETLFWLLVGVGSVCAGSSALNHFIERDSDGKMKRTLNRPLPAGRVKPAHAFQFGFALILAGIFTLYIKINILTSFLSLLTAFMYLLIYTPMKRVSWLNTSIGAFPGAMPPLGGWAAATESLNFDAGILFLILYLWQHPHFYAIAWMFKQDYKDGGYQMLPVVEPSGERMFKHIKYHAMLLIPVSLAPTATGLSGWVYFSGALILGLWLLWVSEKFIKSHALIDAKSLLRASVIYLPVLLALIVFDAQF